MTVTLDWIQLALALGAVQGALLAGALIAHPARRAANRLLAVLMAAFAVYLAVEVYYSAGFVDDHPHFFGLSYPLPWLFGPLVYLYAVTASNAARGFAARDFLHFAPPVLVVVLTLPIYLMSGPEKVALFEAIGAGEIPTVLMVLDPTKYVSGVAYSIATVVHLRRHARRVEHSYSNTQRVNLRWLLLLSASAAAIWLLAIATSLADLVPEAMPANGEHLVALAIALLVFAIGFLGLRQPEIHRFDEPPLVMPRRDSPSPDFSAQDGGETAPAVGQADLDADPGATTALPIPEAERAEVRYERSGLTGAEAAALEAALLRLMDRERPYRDPDLTLPQLAEQLDTTPHKLSEVLNRELGQTFYDFVNAYRVGDVRRRLAESRSQQLSVLAVAMDAGFASKSTFNQVFKKLTGQTPSSYRKALGV